MKNRSLWNRLQFALRGVLFGVQRESNFRLQFVCAGLALILLAVLNAEPSWWAIFLLSIGAVLAAELSNTALEQLLDRLHPDLDPAIGRAKDCAAGAVLILSLTAIGVFLAFLVHLICCRGDHRLPFI